MLGHRGDRRRDRAEHGHRGGDVQHDESHRGSPAATDKLAPDSRGTGPPEQRDSDIGRHCRDEINVALTANATIASNFIASRMGLRRRRKLSLLAQTGITDEQVH
jgi:hypothetical protein